MVRKWFWFCLVRWSVRPEYIVFPDWNGSVIRKSYFRTFRTNDDPSIVCIGFDLVGFLQFIEQFIERTLGHALFICGFLQLGGWQWLFGNQCQQSLGGMLAFSSRLRLRLF